MVPTQVTIEDRYCFIECAIGPNVGLNFDDMTINGVKTKADVAKILEERVSVKRTQKETITFEQKYLNAHTTIQFARL